MQNYEWEPDDLGQEEAAEQDRLFLEEEREQLLKLKKELEEERKAFDREREEENKRLAGERWQLKQSETFFDQKMAILKGGFEQLEEDRKKLERDKLAFEIEKENGKNRAGADLEASRLLFMGVKSQLALKKRYKDLLKMFHPDNVAGDHEMVIMINSAYDQLKREYEAEERYGS